MILLGECAKLVSHGAVKPDGGVAHTISIPYRMQFWPRG
jgi:hypothetical protein